MIDRSFFALIRRLSLAAVSAVKGKKSKGGKKAKKRCQTQMGQCTTFVTDACESSVDPTCLEALDCCAFAGRCDFAGFVTCILQKSEVS